MIERQFVQQKRKEYQIQEYISQTLRGVGHSHTKVQRTPLGEKIVVFASRPGLVVGREGQNIRNLTIELKKRFGLDNPTIEIVEVEYPNLDPSIVVEKITSSLERFGINKFKAVMHKAMEDVMNSGALGCEISVSGKVPSARAKSWRVFAGYMKKCGDLAVSGVKKAEGQALLKSGVIGVKVRIMPPDVRLPDDIELFENRPGHEGVVQEVKVEEKKEEAKKEEKPKRQRKKKEEKIEAKEESKPEEKAEEDVKTE